MRSIPEIYKLRGLQLYEFRITQEEFDAIKTLLILYVKNNRGGITHEVTFQALFVLYAAEWWKRNFDGGHWCWDPIICSIEGNPEQWKTMRSECIRKGLKHWNIPIQDCGGLRYLGAIALQGGLPIRLLQYAHGDIGAILSRVLTLAENSSASESQVRQWVESKKDTLPKSYRHESIYYLLAQVICTTLSLKSEAKLKATNNAVEVLNLAIPKWKERFPVALDDQAAEGLLNQLVTDAAKIQRPRTMRLFPVVRILQAPQEGDTDWHSYSDIEANETLKSDDLQTFFACENLTSLQLHLRFQCGDDRSSTVILRKCIGHDKYRLDAANWHREGADTYAEHRFMLCDANGKDWGATATAGEELDATLPWLFTPGEHNRWQFRWQFRRQGGGKFTAGKILLAIPKNWPCTLKKIGEWRNRMLFEITNDTTVTDLDGQCFRVRPCSADEEDVQQYVWEGDRLWEGIQDPSLTFRNIPSLCLMKNNSKQSIPVSSLKWRRCGEQDWQYRANGWFGPVEARYQLQGELKLRSRMLLLPKHADVQLQEGSDPTQGTLCFSNWGIHHAHVLSTDLTAHCEKQGESLLLHIQCSQDVNPPETVDIELHWSHTTVAAKVRYPFPATGGRLFDGKGQEVASGSRLSAYRLRGYRLWAFGSSIPILKLDTIHRLEATNKRTEIHLMDYEIEIQRMLSRDESPDAHVDMALEVANKQFRIRFLRHAGMLEADTASHCVLLDEVMRKNHSTEQLASIPVYALRLDLPAEEPEKLDVAHSEGVAFGGWEFDFTQHSEAPWLIYTSVDSDILLRPVLWPSEYDEGDGGLLCKAIRTSDPDERKQKLDEALEVLAYDFSDEAWIMVEQLAKKLGHLPLVTLDLWKRFIHVPQAMAALVFRMGSLPDGFIERFAVELPFVWETIPLSAWLAATDHLKTQCNVYFADACEAMFSSQMNNRVEKFLIIIPSLAHLLEWVKTIHIPQSQPPISPTMDTVFRNQLFEGDSAAIQNIRRGHSDKTWPKDFEGWVEANMQGDMEALGYKVKAKFRSSVVNLPLMLAYWVATNSLPSDFLSKANILAIRKHQRFNPEWFNEAFDITILRCLIRDLLKEDERP